MTIQPKLNRFDLTMIIVSLVIGIGIFKTPAIVAQKAETPAIFFVVWIIAGVVSICGALTFAEIGSRLPVAGGFYKIFSYSYHPSYAFMLGWGLVLLSAASSAGVALIGAQYIAPVILPENMQTDNSNLLIAAAIITTLFVLNYAGIRMGSRAQNLLSLLKIGLILFFCFAFFGPHADTVATQNTVRSSSSILRTIGVSLIAVFFTYGGYQQTINFGADVKDAQRNIPRAIFMGMAIIVILYLTINFAYYKVVGFENMKTSTLLASDLAKSFLGHKASKITSVVIFISVLGFLNTSFLSNPRVFYAMAEDGMLPNIFKRVNEKSQAQEFALVFVLLLMILSLVILRTFDNILNYVMFIDILTLVSGASAIFFLRKQAKAEKEFTGYKMRLYPYIPIFFVVVLLGVWVNVITSDFKSALYGFVIFVSGLPLYFVMKQFVR